MKPYTRPVTHQEIWTRGYTAAYQDLMVPAPDHIVAPPGPHVTKGKRRKIWAKGYLAGMKSIPTKQSQPNKPPPKTGTK